MFLSWVQMQEPIVSTWVETSPATNAGLADSSKEIEGG